MALAGAADGERPEVGRVVGHPRIRRRWPAARRASSSRRSTGPEGMPTMTRRGRRVGQVWQARVRVVERHQPADDCAGFLDAFVTSVRVAKDDRHPLRWPDEIRRTCDGKEEALQLVVTKGANRAGRMLQKGSERRCPGGCDIPRGHADRSPKVSVARPAENGTISGTIRPLLSCKCFVVRL